MRIALLPKVMLAARAATFCLFAQPVAAQRGDDDGRARVQQRRDRDYDFDDRRNFRDQRNQRGDEVDGWRGYRNWLDNDFGVNYGYRYPS